MYQLSLKENFELESGEVLEGFEIEYHTFGKPNADWSNVVWVCHALTGSSDVMDWWSGLFGENDLFNPNKYFIVCANVIGSCYGSTGPLSKNLKTQTKYYHQFPQVTVRDMVKAHNVLREHLGIQKIHTVIGGSMGGQQALEWAISHPLLFENLILMATNAFHSPWGIAFNESQRMAIANDPTWKLNSDEAGLEGMKTARAFAMLSYRNYITYENSQTETDLEKTDNYKASSYQQYQGQKLAKRFDAFAYWTLSKAMDSHNVGRGRGSLEEALRLVQANTHVIGIKTDILFPISEQQFLATHIPNASYKEIDSYYGHDGFLVETQKITQSIERFFSFQEELII